MSFRRAIAIALLLAPAAAPAQFVQPLQSDADRLAEQMRRIGANAQDMDALLTAGELSVRMGDMSAAGAFFARAEKIDARNGRAKAGEASILVQSERPGEALRYYTLAEQLGYPPARFAGDRGLAYDLLGDPGRAQRDYKLALAAREDPEVRRRLALSLGIVGRQAQALDTLAPLIRQNDRAAWRSRAFVLAMGGDAAEASRIAQTMMPPGAAGGLATFFAELPRLPAVDKAFAVHFGEVHATPQRLADARIAPREAPLALEPLPVQVAVLAPPPAKKGKRDRRRRDEERVQVAAAAPVPAAPPLPAPPAYQVPAYAPIAAATPVRDRPLTAGEQASLAAAGVRSSGRYSRPTVVAPVQVAGLTSAEQASLAAASGAGRFAPRAPTPAVQPAPAAYAPNVVAPARVTASVAPVYPTPRPVPPLAAAAPTTAATLPTPAIALPAASSPALAGTTPRPAAPAGPTPGFTAPVASPATGQLAQSNSPTPVAPVSTASVAAVPPVGAVPGFSTSPTLPPAGGLAVAAASPAASPDLGAAVPATMPPAAVAVPAPAVAGVGAIAGPPLPDSALAPTPAAIATTAIPATVQTLPTVRPPVVAPAPARVARTPLPPIVRPGRRADAVLAKIVAGLSVPASELGIEGPVRSTGKPAGGRRTLAAKLPVDEPEKTVPEKKADPKKAAAAKQALADRKAAADRKALADKAAADAKRAERAQPARIWVQVAGGANEAGLASAWKTMKGKAPAVLNGRQAYTTPLRATNRVLTGPFKTDAEARAYVNQLNKTGVHAFTFTSDAGQKITKLDTK